MNRLRKKIKYFWSVHDNYVHIKNKKKLENSKCQHKKNRQNCFEFVHDHLDLIFTIHTQFYVSTVDSNWDAKVKCRLKPLLSFSYFFPPQPSRKLSWKLPSRRTWRIRNVIRTVLRSEIGTRMSGGIQETTKVLLLGNSKSYHYVKNLKYQTSLL